MKQNILPYILFAASIFVATLLWDLITIPYHSGNDIIGDSYTIKNYNPLNDIIRFIVFLGIPFITLIYYFKSKIFLYNSKKIILYNNTFQKDKDIKAINNYFFLILFFLGIEFLSLNFNNYINEVDFFHEGMWLSASQNLKINGGYWTSSYVLKGFFGDFYPYFLWNITGNETVGVTRFFKLILIFLNKILLLLIARKISTMINLKKEFKIIYFLFLAITLLLFQGYGSPIFINRSFLLLLYILIFLNFLTHKKFEKTYILILGLISSSSFFWFIDIGLYINFITFVLCIFFALRLEFKNLLYLIGAVLFGWLFYITLIPKEELLEFIKNTIMIFSSINYIHGLVFPTPFISLDIRATRALIIFLITGSFIIISISKKEKVKESTFLISMIFLFIISCIYFNYGLSRSDSGHIRIAQGFVYIPFFSLVFFFLFKNLNDCKKKKLPFFNYLNFFLIFLTLILIFNNKKYEDKKLTNLKNVFKSIEQLVKSDDEKYLSKDYFEFIQYFKNINKNEKCLTIFTNESALYYFLKKPSCSKYYYMWIASPKELQRKIILDIKQKNPTYILYKSDKEIFNVSQKRNTFLDTFIRNNYSKYEKFRHWEVYKLKKIN